MENFKWFFLPFFGALTIAWIYLMLHIAGHCEALIELRDLVEINSMTLDLLPKQHMQEIEI